MGFLEDLKNGDIKSIILVIFSILLFNLYWRVANNTRSIIQTQCKIKEPMAGIDISDSNIRGKDFDVSNIQGKNLSNDIKEAVRQVYIADVEAIRNLSTIAEKLNNKKDGLTIPGNLTVTGSFNYLPRGTIVAYNSSNAPSGWTICDGSNGSPDLRNKFILGSGSRNIGTTGGEENVTLNINQVPAHSHSGSGSTNTAGHHNHGFGVGGGGGGRGGGRGTTEGYTCSGCAFTSYTDGNGNHSHSVSITTDSRGGNQPHNNMPPFYVLTYIMKL